jgi:hypothetical protein
MNDKKVVDIEFSVINQNLPDTTKFEKSVLREHRLNILGSIAIISYVPILIFLVSFVTISLDYTFRTGIFDPTHRVIIAIVAALILLNVFLIHRINRSIDKEQATQDAWHYSIRDHTKDLPEEK